MKISIVINCDSRSENNKFGGSNLTGVANEDMIVDGLINKVSFFDGFETEVIVHLDKHNPISSKALTTLWDNSDVLIVRNHTNEQQFNDNNYIRALSYATGDIIVHIDQDTATFNKAPHVVEKMIAMLDEYAFLSYPSHWHPLPCHDESFDHVWVSTRWFMCKRESLDLIEILKCKEDYDYWCNTYPVNRRCPWLEHWIGSIAKYRNQKILYPPIDTSECAIFSWGSYTKGTLKMLNKMPYEEVQKWVDQKGIHYPVDVFC